MSKPVIGCKIPFLTIRDGDDGFLVEQSPPALAEKITRLLGNPDEARAMGARGHARVETEYSWEAIVSKVEAFYHKLRERK